MFPLQKNSGLRFFINGKAFHTWSKHQLFKHLSYFIFYISGKPCSDSCILYAYSWSAFSHLFVILFFFLFLGVGMLITTFSISDISHFSFNSVCLGCLFKAVVLLRDRWLCQRKWNLNIKDKSWVKLNWSKPDLHLAGELTRKNLHYITLNIMLLVSGCQFSIPVNLKEKKIW